MTKFNQALLQSMLELVQKTHPDAIEVVAYDQITNSTGYCDTCYDEWEEVEIFYTSSTEENTQTYRYTGDFGELIRRLTDDSE